MVQLVNRIFPFIAFRSASISRASVLRRQPFSISMASSSSERTKPTILVTRTDYLPSSIDYLKKYCNVEMWDNEKNGALEKEELIKRIKGKFGLFCCSIDKISPEVLEAGAPSLKIVSTMSVGVDHVDLGTLKKLGMRLGYTPGVLTEATAELTVGLLLATSRRLTEAANEVKTGKWVGWAPFWLHGQGLENSTVGIVGYGRIGHSVAVKLKAFAVDKILYTSREEKKDATKIGATLTDIDTLMKTSDFVVVTLALTPETKGIISKERIALMKPTAIFVNTGRGGLVDQDALVEALQQKKILAAGLDVMTPEPIPFDHPLQKLDNCVLLPHIGSDTYKARERMSMLTAENIVAVVEGKPMPAEYNI